MATHKVNLDIVLTLEDMDGTTEESALIALNLVDEGLLEVFPPGEITDVQVTDYWEEGDA